MSDVMKKYGHHLHCSFLPSLKLALCCTIIRFLKAAVAELDGNVDKVKHTHRMRFFERYLMI